MRKRLIYICSPLRGDIEKNIQKAQGYCREAVDLWPDVIPIAPHVYCTQFLDDTIPQEREAGMELGIALLDMCDELWVYGINNPSEGMKKEIAYAKEHGIPVKDAADLVPWGVWRDMRKLYGHKHMNKAELEPFRVQYIAGVLKLLEGIELEYGEQEETL